MNDTSLLSLPLRPATTADSKRLDAALRHLMDDDPTLRITEDQATGQTVIWGIAELQLEIVVDRLKREFGVEAAIGGVQVAYKETIKMPADGEVKYAAHTGGRGQYAHVKIHVYPAEPGTGCTFEDRIVVGAIPKAFIRPIEEGIQEAMTRGVLAGYPVDGVRVELYDGSYHDVDSSDEAFRTAARMAFPSPISGESRVALPEPGEDADE
ncbi:MAG TPA: hypothetical protein VFY90_05960 [Tepidiformaceae bacterium]|nr:hypothetical protein [Tepidiformaceae bacterium]